MPEHPSKDELSGLLLGTLAPEVTDEVADHVGQCLPCQTVHDLEAHKDTLLRSLQQPAPPPLAADCQKVVSQVAAIASSAPQKSSAESPSEPSLPSQSQAAGPTRDEFVSVLLASGILEADEWARLKAHVSDVAQAKDGAVLAKALVRAGALTKFQANLLYQGKAKGLLFGEYVVLDRIGAGGMGQVFKARHRSMDRIVALKVLAKAAVNSPDAVKRFQREVMAAARLIHPNIVTAFDAGRQDGVHFLVMEFVDSSDLSSLIKRDGPLPVAKAIDCVRQTACGLAFAHSKGVVHRDIKPANLLIDSEGTVKILDMGLARLEGDTAALAHEGLTQSGQVMGTIDYMAPEQAFDTRAADAKADMYSLGCTLYRLLTGNNLFAGETLVQKLLAHREQPIPSLRAVRPEVSPQLDAIYQRMVAKQPEDRPTMAGLAAELESLQKESGTRSQEPTEETAILDGLRQAAAADSPHRRHHAPRDASPHAEREVYGAQPPWRNRKVLAAAGAAGFIVLLCGIWIIIRDKDGGEAARLYVPDGKTAEIVADGASPANLESQISDLQSSAPPGDYALHFDANSRNSQIPNAGFDPRKPFTIEAWLRFDPENSADKNAPHVQTVLSGNGVDLSAGPISNSGRKWAWGIMPRASATLSTCRSGEAIRGDTWMHVAGTFDGRTQRLYVDGVPQKDAPMCAPAELKQAEPFLLGRLKVRHFIGTIDELRLSQVARYRGSFTPTRRFPPDADTLALYHFDEGAGDVLTDSSGNNHHGKITGATWVRADGSAITLPSPLAGEGSGVRGSAPPLAVAPFDSTQARAHQEAWARHLGTTVETTNTVGAKIVLIPPGEFLMGSTDEQLAAALKVAEELNVHQTYRDNIQNAERPQHKVAITKPLVMGKTEVTVGQFRQFATATNYQTDAEKADIKSRASQPPSTKPGQPLAEPKPLRSYFNPSHAVTDDSPATLITWNDAVAYCNWLAEQENLEPCYRWEGKRWLLVPHKNGYRLPTEAEWEYACRAGTTTQYSFGDDHGQLVQYGWHNRVGGSGTHAVGVLLPNGFGLHDMHGNLQEWCQDFWDEKWYAVCPLKDPTGPVSGVDHVIRGGYASAPAAICRSAYRSHLTSNNFNSNYGFRCVRTIHATATATSTSFTPR